MLQVKRLDDIAKILERNGTVDINDLSKRFGVTSKTIRKDLEKLEEMGLLDRVHGGAVLKNNNENNVFPIAQRKRKNMEEKERIARAAFEFIDEGDIIIIDGGTTTWQLSKVLGDKEITVITNDMLIASELMIKQNISLFVIGGRLMGEGSFTLLGRDAERGFGKYQANKLFLTTSALDFIRGLMVFSVDEAELKKAMIGSAREIICLVDYSKFHNIAFVPFCGLEKINTLITDDRITDADRDYIKEIGIKLEVVKKSELNI